MVHREIRNATYQQAEGWLADWLRGNSSGDETDSGVYVNEKSALSISTVWKCVRARGETFGMLPKKMFERVQMLNRPGRQEAPQHSLYGIVHDEPNPVMTSMQFFEALSADLDLWGNSYAYIERGEGTGRIRNLWRLRPDMIRIETRSGVLWYHVCNELGFEERFSSDEILHVRGLGFDGVQGYSPIRLLMDTLGWSKATVRHGAVFFKNASRPGGLLISPGTISEPTKSELIASLKQSGKKAGSLTLIEGSLEYKDLAMKQDEAQFIETMQLQEEDICGIFRTPPHKAGILRQATNNNIEHQAIEWVTDSIQPICERVEQAFNQQLLSDLPSSGRGGGTEQDRFFMECELKGLLRGDTAARTAWYQARFSMGSMSQNEMRQEENEPPFPGGDNYWIQLNMTTIENAIKLASMPKEDGGTPTKEDIEARISAELQLRFRGAYWHVFRDAVGRVLARSKDRDRVVPGVFGKLVEGLAEGLGCAIYELVNGKRQLTAKFVEFLATYLAGMGDRAAGWEDPEAVTAKELDGTILALLEFSK